MKTPCREKGCERTFKSVLAERMHFHRVHSGHIVAAHEKPHRARVRFGNGNEGTVALQEPPAKRKGGPGSYWAAMTKAERSAEMKRRTSLRLSRARGRGRKPVAQEVQINYCPNCGCHIHGIAMGMAVASHLK